MIASGMTGQEEEELAEFQAQKEAIDIAKRAPEGKEGRRGMRK